MSVDVKIDRLEKMLQLQREFHELVGPSLKSASEADCERMIADTMRNLIVECVEVMQSINWKPWKKKRVDPDWRNVKDELADCQIFLMNAAMEAGMTDEDLYQAVMRKIHKNVERQKNGY